MLTGNVYLFEEKFTIIFLQLPQKIVGSTGILKEFSAVSGLWDFKCDTETKHLSD
jgi:hypothetical protein